ncbi:hypothetical protein [Nonlabens sp. Asnod3-A02]|uniref:hypothetical protein n=1 Tax=Nonlabens sp. Asnod3-A02 TaxID=3160579 RepID=UPI0038668537
MFRYLRTFRRDLKEGRKLMRIEKEPLLEFSYQVFQNDIPRIEIIRLQSLINYEDIGSIDMTKFAVKIISNENDDYVSKIKSSMYGEYCANLIHPPKTPVCQMFIMKNRINKINQVVNNILIQVFDFKTTDLIETGIELYE